MTIHDKNFDQDDAKFSNALDDWFDWEIDDGEIALTRGGEVKLNGKALNPSLVKMAAAHSSAFQDAVRKWKLKAEELACESEEQMTDVKALRELEVAKRIINKHIDDGFVTDFCHDQQGYFGFFYNPKRYAEIAENIAADAA